MLVFAVFGIYAIFSASPTETELYGESALIPQCGLGTGLGSGEI